MSPPDFTIQSDPPLKSGPLRKQRRHLGGWVTRWFELDWEESSGMACLLVYHKGDLSDPPARISLEFCFVRARESMDDLKASGGPAYCIELDTRIPSHSRGTGRGVEGKVSHFFAASVQEREEWVEAIAWCAVNSNLDNGYIIEKGDDAKLGVGSYSMVWKGCDRRTRKDWAIKEVCKADLEQVELQNLREEVRIQRRVGEHPNIVYMKELVETPNRYYIVMELLVGGALLDRILDSPNRQFSEHQALDIMKQVLNALAFLHSKHICHRDLKPENLLLTDEPATGGSSPSFGYRVCIADFGFAATAAEGPACLHGLCGSPGYIAPEIIRDSREACGYGLAVDLWSMGVILYILLTGNPPFVGDTDEESFALTLRAKYNWLSLSEVSATSRDLVANLLVFKPERRLTAELALNHPWILGQGVGDSNLRIQDNLRTLQANIRSKKEYIASGLSAAVRKLKFWS